MSDSPYDVIRVPRGNNEMSCDLIRKNVPNIDIGSQLYFSFFIYSGAYISN